ncbi:MAG: hypothetical protein PHO37_13680 [Kiritimatiellae bacterium]|nr:hypothetical protein [Kiritimatiellia bacterium]
MKCAIIILFAVLRQVVCMAVPTIPEGFKPVLNRSQTHGSRAGCG